jgi:HEAT repeat protein
MPFPSTMRRSLALGLAALWLALPAAAWAPWSQAAGEGPAAEPPPEPPGAGAPQAPPPPSGGNSSSDPLPSGGKLPPGLAKLLRKNAGKSTEPPPGPKPGRTPGETDAASASSLRSWELWWELHRDRYVVPRRRDLSLNVGRIPPDPRTRAQSVDALVGAFERIEPSLRLVIDHERSDIVLARALVALAKLGENPRAPGSRSTYATILPYLHHQDAQLREAAITALGVLGTEEALFPLAEIARGGRATGGATPLESGRATVSDRQRALALYAMGMVGRDSGREDVRRLAASRICALLSQEPDAPAEVRFAGIHALSLVPLFPAEADPREPSAGEVRAPESAPSRTTRRPWKRRQPSVYPRVEPRPIPTASRAAEIHWLLSVLDDPSQEGWIRAQAATAAGRLCADLPEGSAVEQRVANRLLSALGPRSRDGHEVQQSAVLALGEFADGDRDEVDSRVRASLARALAQAEDASVREFAYLSLALVASRPGGGAEESDRLLAVGEVRKLLLERAASVRALEQPYALLALGLFEHGIAEANGALLTGGPAGAAWATGAESRSALTASLAEAKSTEVAAACALAVGLAGAQEAVPQLIRRLEDGEVGVRRCAALALGLLRAREAAPALERLLTEARQEPELYRDVSEALALLGAPVARQLLSQMGEGASLESQMHLCFALGRVGDGSSLRALFQAASDSSTLVWVRAAATSALGNLGSCREGDWNADLGHALNFHRVPATLSAVSLDGLLDLE